MQDSVENNVRVAFYCRVSTEEQREGQTIDSQVKELERFTADKGWIVTGIYKDDGWSGSILARPELDRLRDDASRGLFSVVLINDVDRLARDVSHLGIIKRDLERKSVRVVFRKLPGESSPTYNLMVNVLGSFAEFERELIADRTRRGRRYKVEVRKQYLGAIAPYGFRRTPRDKVNLVQAELEILAEEATVVRQMYAWVDAEALSIQKVLAQLNRRCIPARKGKPWQKSSVRSILRSQIYAGVWHYNKHRLCEPMRGDRARKYRRSLKTSMRLRPKAEWLPIELPNSLRIIPREQWERVQKQLDRNIPFSPRNTKHPYLLSGLLRCGGCGSAYVGDPNGGHFGYRCLKRCRKVPSIKEAFLNNAVWAAVEEALSNPKVLLEGFNGVLERNARATAAISGGDELSRALEQLRREEARILEAYRLEILSAEQLAKELETLKTRRSSLESTMSSMQPPKPISESVLRGPVGDACQLLAQRLSTLDFSKKQLLLRTLLTKIIFYGERVKLIGALPLDDDLGRTDTEKARIANTTSRHHVRNSDEIATTTSERYVPNFGSADHANALPFELVRPVQKDRTASAACCANLLKTNATLERIRLAHNS
jgi:site-specific DNA recombinase